MGARAHGMGWASACLSDVWAVTNNIAGLADTERAAVAFSYHATPSFKPFNRAAAVAAIPFKKGVAGAGVFRFGDDLYNEQLIMAGFANRFGLASLGLKVNLIQYQASGKGTTRALTVSFGGLAQLTPHLSFGAHISNINQPLISDRTGERIPTRLTAGLAFIPTDKLVVAAEVEKDSDYPPTARAGMEYRIFRKIAFRTGFDIHPERGFLGVGFSARKFDLDYALEVDYRSGMSHQATVVYQFRK